VKALLLRLLGGLILLVSLSVAAPSFEPEQLVLLVIGRSAARPEPDQRLLLKRVQALRDSPGLEQLRVATMHFDRPREAAFARKTLGVTPDQLPCVCLVQLDASGQRPQKSLYCWPRVTGARLAQVDQMAETWSQIAHQPLPLITPQAPKSPSPPDLTVSSAPSPSPSPAYYVAPRQPQPPLPSMPESTRDRVLAGVTLGTDSWLLSTNRRFGCCFQADGNMVIYDFGVYPFRAVWNSQTQKLGAAILRLGSDGVLRMMGSGGNVVWQVGDSSFFSHCYLQMQDDGNLVIYRQNGNGLSVDWASNTVISPP